MKIGELAVKTGMTPTTIRFYENAGILDGRHVERLSNNYRVYSDAAVGQLLVLRDAKAAGFTLSEFRELDKACLSGAGSAQQTAALLHRKIEAIDLRISEMERTKAFLLDRLAGTDC